MSQTVLNDIVIRAPAFAPPTRARYDLSQMPCNFNCIEFLVAATTRGTKEVLIDSTRGFINKYSTEDSMNRLFSIVVPACALAGVKVNFGSNGQDMPYHISAVLSAYHDMGFIKKLESVKPHGSVKYTVTLRDYDRTSGRNSNRDAWEKFASDIGAMVIDDWYKNPISLHERMALYCGAEMNFHVGGGTSSLCYFSEAPLMTFCGNANEVYHRKHGFPKGSQLPWLNKRQRFVWKSDDYDTIRREWDSFQEAA